MIGIKKLFAIIAGCVLLFIVGVFVYSTLLQPSTTPAEPEKLPLTFRSSASFVCSSNRILEVSFFEDPNFVSTSTPPVPSGIIRVAYPDGRTVQLPQTLSADGAQYANQDESQVYWNKGNGLRIEGNGAEGEYKNCIVLASTLPGVRLPIPYVTSDGTFSIRLPSRATETSDGFRIDEGFNNQIAPDRIIPGVKFTIPESMAKGTNLGTSTYLSVEHLPLTVATATCEAALFLDGTHSTSSLTDGNVTYSVASSSNAGAGNRYTDYIFAIPNTNPCIAIHYNIHSVAIENYSSGTVREYDSTALLTLFDNIRKSITLDF